MGQQLNEALKLIERGFAIIPVHAGKKKPFGEGWQNKPLSPDDARRHWLNYPHANFGILLGYCKDFVSIDLDCLDGFKDEYLKIFPRTWTVRTRNGAHLYFKRPILETNRIELLKGDKRFKECVLSFSGRQHIGPTSIVDCEFDKEQEKWVQITPHEYSWYSDAGGELSPWEIAEPAECAPWFFDSIKDPTVRKSLYPDGSRHNFLIAVGTAMRKRDEPLEKVEAEIWRMSKEKCKPPHDPNSDADRKEIDLILKWCATLEVNPLDVKKKQERLARKGFDPGGAEVMGPELDEDGKPIKEAPLLLAKLFLSAAGFSENNEDKIRFYRDEFYQYNGTRYEVSEPKKIEAAINGWLERSGRWHLAGVKNTVGAIVACLRSEPRYVDSKHDLPVWIEDSEIHPSKHFLSLQNGIFDLRKYCDTGEAVLWPHTPKFFTSYSLPYSYEAGAACPNYDRIALEMFGSEEKKSLWEEILGIHLYQPFILEHFFMLQGEGGNGKSVLLLLLRLLLGHENCSAVPLHAFKGGDFVFTGTLGKLANIVSDQGDIDKFDEGLLKQFVSREPMIYNRKGLPVITARPTAFMTIGCNQLPVFSDKSDGLWRRIVLFQIPKQVEEERRDPKFVTPEFWEASGELAGVFNRALEGLRRVALRGKLAQVQSLRDEAKEYRKELNLIAQFASDCIKTDPFGCLPSLNVYEAYRLMAQKNGYRSVGSRRFYKELVLELKKQGVFTEFSKDKKRIPPHYVGHYFSGVDFTEFGASFRASVELAQFHSVTN